MHYFRKIIQISAEDSPNVKLARAEIAKGRKPSNTIVIPGVLTWEEYQARLKMWDEVRKSVGLYARFYKGALQLLFPQDWLNNAHNKALQLRGSRRAAKAIGIDTGEGIANTSMAAVDERGLIELDSQVTPDTSVIPGNVIAFGQRHGVPSEKWFFDRGGGGQQHADRLRAKGYRVQTVAFGESLVLDPKRSKRLFQERVENKEVRYTYKNRRAQMFGVLSLLLDPANEGWAIPVGSGHEHCPYTRLRKQLAVIPKQYDGEGRMFLPPKNKVGDGNKTVKTLVELIGHSPDEADAVVLAVYGMCQKIPQARAGAVG